MAQFPKTSWTLLAKLGEQSEQGAYAREDFAQRYHRPVRDFLSAILQNAEEARDLSQEFFTKLCQGGGGFVHATQEKGAFRNFLRKSLRNLAVDYHRQNGKEALYRHPDQESAGGWEAIQPPRLLAAEDAFHQTWVRITLAEALNRVRAICRKQKQHVHLELFEARYLAEADVAPSWAELGARYGLDQKVARDRARTVVDHFRTTLRRLLSKEIRVRGGARVTEAMIDKEIRALLAPLSD